MANTAHTLRGFATSSFYAADLEAAKEWYTRFLGLAPYFERPGYIEFRVGDYQHELGIIDSRYQPGGPSSAAGGAIIYWHVDDVQATFDRLLELGAKTYEPVTKRSETFVTASVVDPFGNVLGVMSNLHYMEVLAGLKG